MNSTKYALVSSWSGELSTPHPLRGENRHLATLPPGVGGGTVTPGGAGVGVHSTNKWQQPSTVHHEMT